MAGRWRVLFLLVVAVFAASCGAPSFTSRDAAEHRSLPRTDPDVTTNIDGAAVLDRGTTTVPGTSVTSRVVDGIELALQANPTATFTKDTPAHLVLSITNK